MSKIKPYILPVAIVLGVLLHSWSGMVVWMVPYLVFTILLLNFCSVDLLKMRFRKTDMVVMVFQTVVSIGVYLLIRLVSGNEALAQGALACVLCPVASSVVVVTAALGIDRKITTGYTIYGNLLIAVLAPIYFSRIGIQQDMPFVDSALLIFKKIAAVIALPYFLALAMQLMLPKVKDGLSRFREWALPLWALALLFTLGRTIDYIFLYHEGNVPTIIALGVVSVAICILQFGFGRIAGRRLGQPVAVSQMMGQKNTGIGIWMSFMYLLPLASVALAFYSIAQNIFNSWQMWHHDHPKTQLTP